MDRVQVSVCIFTLIDISGSREKAHVVMYSSVAKSSSIVGQPGRCFKGRTGGQGRSGV